MIDAPPSPFRHCGPRIWTDEALATTTSRKAGTRRIHTRGPSQGHRFGLNLAAEDKRALIAFLKTLPLLLTSQR